MNNVPRQALRRMVAKHGKDVCADARRCENLLKDSCGSYRREINVLVAAVEDRVPLDLLAAGSSMPLELLITRLEKRLEEQTAMTRDAARWAVESWALALNVATEAQIDTRQLPESSPSKSSSETTQPSNTADDGNLPKINKTNNTNRTNPVQPPQPKITASSRKINLPPIMPQPTKKSPLPPVFSPANNSPAVQPPVPMPTANPQIQAPNSVVNLKSRIGLFRGCLLLIFLLVIVSTALFLGVPYAIEVMRETQREKSVEPPRFPSR